MSLGKSSQQSQSERAQVWGGQAPYLQGLYQQGANLLPQAMQMGQGILPQIQQAMTPQGYGQVIQQTAQPYLQGIQDQSIQAMNLGGSRQGVAQAQLGQNLAGDYFNALPQLYNLGLGASGFAPLAQYAGLLGSPTVLGGASRSSGRSMNLGVGE